MSKRTYDNNLKQPYKYSLSGKIVTILKNLTE